MVSVNSLLSCCCISFTYSKLSPVRFLVPCSLPNKLTIKWLGQEAVKRYSKLQPSSFIDGRHEEIREIRRTKGGALLDPDDYIINTLDSNDFVSVG